MASNAYEYQEPSKEQKQELEKHKQLIENLIGIIEDASKNKKKLAQDFFNIIINNPNICNLPLNMMSTYFILKNLLFARKVYSSKYNNGGIDTVVMQFYGTSFKQSVDSMKEQFPWMYMYFILIKSFLNKNYDVFSLGSSLEKPNMVWNAFHSSEENNLIKEIPLSGSMFEYGEPDPEIGGSRRIILNPEKMQDMIEKFPLLLKNNPAFSNLVDTLNRDEKDVLITDVKGSGKSLKTLLFLFNSYKINVRKLHFLYITTKNDEDDGVFNNIVDDELKQYNYHNPILFFNSQNIDIYFIKGEDYGARCIAHYQREVWNEPPTPVFYNDPLNEDMIINNFRQCNLNNVLFLIFTACFFREFVIPGLKKFNIIGIIPDIISINKEINDFIDERLPDSVKEDIKKETETETQKQLERNAKERRYKVKGLNNVDKLEEFNKKYLKYKLKYLKLKEKIENFIV
jgi:hypothetical protein